MKVFYNASFTGFWPVGTAAVIVANDRDEANRVLQTYLEKIGLENNRPDETTEVVTDKVHAIILRDGNY